MKGLQHLIFYIIHKTMTKKKQKGGAGPRRKGDCFERLVKKRLIEQGFFCIRQPRSAFPDLIAIRKGDSAVEVLFIECKIGKYISAEERKALNSLAEDYGGTPMVCYKSEGGICFCTPDYGKI